MDEYMIAMEYRTEKAIVRVRRPILTPEERAKRMEEIRKAAANVILAAERQKAQRG